MEPSDYSHGPSSSEATGQLSNSVWRFATAGTIHFGRGSRERLAEELSKRGLRRPLVVTDAIVGRLQVVSEITQRLLDDSESVAVFDQGQAEPGIEVADAAISAGREAGADCVIGIGGGSNIDVAKMAAIVLRHGGKPAEYFGFDRVPGPVMPLLALPTTAGTGSEVSHSAVLTDSDQSIKVSTLSPWLRPMTAIVDPALTDSCPKRVTAESGMDALVHAIEAYTNRDFRQMAGVDPQTRAYEGSYPLTRLLAAEAIRLVGKSLVKACNEPQNHAARDDMALAATLAGMAFSNSGVGIVHALEYPIGALTHCSHGEGNGLLLPHVMQYNLPVRQREFAEVAIWLGEESNAADGVSAERAVEAVVRLQKAVGIRTQLRQLGLNRQSIPQVAEKAHAIRRLMDLNPQPPKREDLIDILNAAF